MDTEEKIKGKCDLPFFTGGGGGGGGGSENERANTGQMQLHRHLKSLTEKALTESLHMKYDMISNNCVRLQV